MQHYFDSLNPVEFAQVQFNLENETPEDKIFVGQGVTESVGSNKYGYYVAKVFNNKFIALVPADSKFMHGWQDGSMECTRPDNWQDENTWQYYKKYGKNGTKQMLKERELLVWILDLTFMEQMHIGIQAFNRFVYIV